jgi:hypothetical protein
VIRVFFVSGWQPPGDAPPDLVAEDAGELLRLADGEGSRQLDAMKRSVLRAVAGRIAESPQPVDVIASGAVYKLVPRAQG